MNLEMDLSIYSVARFLIVAAESRLGFGRFGGIFIRERFQNEHSSFALDPHNVARDLVEDVAPLWPKTTRISLSINLLTDNRGLLIRAS